MIPMPPVKYERMTLAGGMDQITPTLSLPPGVVRDALNFECLEMGGYGRIGGYERYSGKPSPSDAVYTTLWITTFTNTPAVGATITNGTATGVIIAVGVNYVAITKQVGAFAVGDSLTVGATPIGTMVAPPLRCHRPQRPMVNLAANPTGLTLPSPQAAARSGACSSIRMSCTACGTTLAPRR
jgi:hypothetical protein